MIVRDGELVGLFDTFEEAAPCAVEKFGRGPYLIRRVGAPPVTLPASIFVPTGSRARRRLKLENPTSPIS